MKKAKQTAAQTYAERQNDVGVLLDLIAQEMQVHAERQAEDPRNWGFAGDLGEVKRGLMETLSFLMGGQDENANREMIEAHLAEMRK